MAARAVSRVDPYLRELSGDPAWQALLDDWTREPDPVRQVALANRFAAEHGRRLPRESGEILPQALVLARVSEDRLGQARCLASLGWCRLHADQHQVARSTLIEGLELGRELDDGETILSCLEGLGVCHGNMGLHERAILYFREALDRAEQAGELGLQGRILTKLARCHLDLGHAEVARECLQRIDPHDLSGALDRACYHLRLGMALRRLGELAAAGEQLEGAIAAAESDPELLGAARIEQVWLRLAEGKAAEAAVLMDGLPLARGAGPSAAAVEFGFAQAAVFEAQGRLAEAQAALERVLAAAESQGAGPNRVTACEALSRLLAGQSQFEAALAYAQRAHAYAKQQARGASASLIAGFQEEQTRREAQLNREQYRQMVTLGEIGRLITSSLERSRILELIHDHVRRLMPADAFQLGIHDPVADCLFFEANRTDGKLLPPYRLPLAGDNLASRCFRDQAPVLINNLAADYESYPTEELDQTWIFPMAGLLYVPVQHGLKTLGVLGVQCRQAGVYTAHHQTTLAVLASYLAVALENAQLYERLRVLAEEDSLTACLTRRRFTELARDELRRAKRYKAQLTVVMMDLDHFKQINDSWGHDAGDRVLAESARLVRRLLRDSDLMCRWGGEEFVLLLPHTELDGGALLAERIRQAMAQNSVVLADGQKLSVSASFGLSARIKDETSLDVLVRRADQALYQAKSRGRNRVETISE